MQVQAWCSNSGSGLFFFCCEVWVKLFFSSLMQKAALVCFLMTLQHIGIEFSHRAETDGQASWCMANWKNENIHAQKWVSAFSLQQRDHKRYIEEQGIYWANTWKNKSTKKTPQGWPTLCKCQQACCLGRFPSQMIKCQHSALKF